MIEAVVTFGPDTRVHVSGATAHEVLALLTEVEKSEIPLTLGRVRRGAGTQESLGRHLGAELIGEESKAQEPAPNGFGEETLPPGVKIVPGAPLIAGKPAWLMSGEKNGRPWTAFIHPKADVDRSLPVTDNPDDPRLAAGTANFWKFLK